MTNLKIVMVHIIPEKVKEDVEIPRVTMTTSGIEPE